MDVPSVSEFAFISLGSNLSFSTQELNSPEEILSFAFTRLESLSKKPLLKSRVYITSPIDSPLGTPDFFNAVAGLIPSEDEKPHLLLSKLQAIENDAGRYRSGIKNEARTLDLDLITFRNEIIKSDELILPHPRAHERRFVLEPLAEIAGAEFCLPSHEKSIAGYLADMFDSQKVWKHQH